MDHDMKILTLALQDIEADIIYQAEIIMAKINAGGSFSKRIIAAWCSEEEVLQLYTLKSDARTGNLVAPLRTQARTFIQQFKNDANACEGRTKLLDLYFKATHDLRKVGHDCRQKLELLANNLEYIYTSPWDDYHAVYFRETCLMDQLWRLNNLVRNRLYLFPEGLAITSELRGPLSLVAEARRKTLPLYEACRDTYVEFLRDVKAACQALLAPDSV